MMSTRMLAGHIGTACLLAASCAYGEAALCADTAVVYNQQQYTSASSSCAYWYGILDLEDLLYSDDIAGKWHDEIAPWSFTANTRLNDFAAEMEDIIDDDIDPEAEGTDDQSGDGIDTYDIALVLAHGSAAVCGPSCTDWTIVRFVDTDVAVNDGAFEECSAESASEMGLGDGALNQAFFFSDRSLNYETWDEGGLDIDAGSFALYAGFHGPKTERASDDNDMASFVSTSRTSGVGEHWISEFVQRPLGSDNDDCPTVIVWGSSSSVAMDYYHNAGLDDYPGVGTHSTSVIVYPTNCNPPGSFEASL